MKTKLVWSALAAAAVFAVVIGVALEWGLAVALQRDPAGPRPVVAQFDRRLADLPLFEYPSTHAPKSPLIVMYSGDNGWAKADRGFATALAQNGYPVVGVDSLRYLLTPRSADGAAADLSRAIDGYSRAWGPRGIVLTGYSYGANALPIILARLPQRLQSRVRLVALIAPGRQGRLVFKPYHWLDFNWPGSTSLERALSQAGLDHVICIRGDMDVAAHCPDQAQSSVSTVLVRGDHRYKGTYKAVAEAIMAADSLSTSRTLLSDRATIQ